MRIHFHGAAGEVTGSLHLVEAAGRRILLDCGMIQGSPEQEARNAEPFSFDPASIDALVLSHAHIDHIGRVPLLVKRGFRGPIFAQAATADLMPIMPPWPISRSSLYPAMRGKWWAASSCDVSTVIRTVPLSVGGGYFGASTGDQPHPVTARLGAGTVHGGSQAGDGRQMGAMPRRGKSAR